MITDGRDTAPQCADRFARQVDDLLQKLGKGFIAGVCGCYYAMNRAGYWDRTQKAWAAYIRGDGLHAGNTVTAIQEAWKRGEGDEFIQPTLIGDAERAHRPQRTGVFLQFPLRPYAPVECGHGHAGFRPFRPGHGQPAPGPVHDPYNDEYPFPVLFPTEFPYRVLAEVVSDAGLRQFHCAETEKYAHVTYFFNGGREEPFPGEDREIIPSPKVATYDLQPEMSAPQVADRIIAAVESRQYAFVLVNFANGDMVGHTAKIPAIIHAVETLDLQFHRVVQAVLTRGFRIILTADHGNCDEMVDPVTSEPHTQHTVYPVPFLPMGEAGTRLGIGRGAADVAPTVLDLMGFAQPEQMTGRSILLKKGIA